jgi:hypothetical protein
VYRSNTDNNVWIKIVLISVPHGTIHKMSWVKVININLYKRKVQGKYLGKKGGLGDGEMGGIGTTEINKINTQNINIDYSSICHWSKCKQKQNIKCRPKSFIFFMHSTHSMLS